ncbi:putative Insect cuticle protein domain-containing protein 12, partial [Homarus americanus]
QVVWAAVITGAAVWASPADDLRPEHRSEPYIDLADLPVASNNMFIWNNPDGSYRFGMQGNDQWRVESRDPDGTVKGRYFYRTPEGREVDVSYDSGRQGYRARGQAIPGGAAPLQQEDITQEDDQVEQQILLKLAQQPQQPQLQEDEKIASPYGALLLSDVEETFPSGDGITTYSDTENMAIITDVQLQHLQEAPEAVFPVILIPGTSDVLSGPPHVNDNPVLPAAISV